MLFFIDRLRYSSNPNDTICQTLYFFWHTSIKNRFTSNDIWSTFSIVNQLLVVRICRINIVCTNTISIVIIECIMRCYVRTLSNANLRRWTNKRTATKHIDGDVKCFDTFCPIEKIDVRSITKTTRTT